MRWRRRPVGRPSTSAGSSPATPPPSGPSRGLAGIGHLEVASGIRRGKGRSMALTDKLRDLDQRLLPGTRNDGEDAEAYLRRVAASRAISPAQAGDVMAALRVYFGGEPGEGEGDAGRGDAAAE